MTSRRSTRHKRCSQCHIHQALCFCALVPKVDCNIHVSYIIHHRERFLTSNTAMWAHWALPQSQIFYRGHLDIPEDYSWIKNDGRTFLLFPADNAQLIHTIERPSEGPINLIIPDGTWRQAKKFHKRIPELKDIPCLAIKEDYRSQYFLRLEHQEHYLSTFEATMLALRALSPNIEQGELLFSQLQDYFLEVVKRFRISRHCYSPQLSMGQMEDILQKFFPGGPDSHPEAR